MDNRTIFLNACNEISNRVGSFNATEKGQRLKKSSADKDIYFEIYFQSSFRNNDSSIQMHPVIGIYSKALRKWQIEQTKSKYCQGVIFISQIGNLAPYNNWKEWNIAGNCYEKSVSEITENIKQYVLPIFDIFKSKEYGLECFFKVNFQSSDRPDI